MSNVCQQLVVKGSKMKVDKDILHRYAQGECTEQERILIEEWFDNDENNRSFTNEEVDKIVNLLDQNIKKTWKIAPILKWSTVAAAVILMVVTFIFYKNGSKSEYDKFADIQSIKAPVSSFALLVMEDGSEYLLDDIQYSDTLRANGYEITRLPTGEINYLLTPGEEEVMHTLKTKKGGLASIQLNDETKVWINSDSELRYFTGKFEDRKVHLQGEGYFEVSNVYEGKEKQPFTVYGQQKTIQVLGTKFNADFTSKNRVALLEGKVELSETSKDKDGSKLLLMTSGQVFENDSLYTSVEIERYIDWKEGYFDLRKLNIYDLAIELSNWYRIKVKVEEGFSDKLLFGRVSRNHDLIHVLEVVNEVIPINYDWKDNALYIYE